MHFEMLRAFFAPYGDAPDRSIPRGQQDHARPACRQSCPASDSPALIRDARSSSHLQSSRACTGAMLAGPAEVLRLDTCRAWRNTCVRWWRPACVARRQLKHDGQCMLRPNLLRSRQLQWYLERKAAVLVAGGSMSNVLAAYCQDGTFSAALPCLLLWQHSGCAVT